MIGPNVTLATPMHPLLPEERNIRMREDGSFYNLEYAKPITIKIIAGWHLMWLFVVVSP